tara:strand:+ start:132523 stop:134469 length:1947 start_codon:yes stop_codon:yes gene_type:complete
MESPRCGSLRPIFLEFEGFEVDHLHVVDQNKDTSSSELFEAVDSLLGDIEETTQSLEPKEEEAIDPNALIGDVGELPIKNNPTESTETEATESETKNPVDPDAESPQVTDPITNAQQALDEVEHQAEDLVSQSLDSMLDQLDELDGADADSVETTLPNGKAELESLDAEISTEDLLESIDTVIDQMDKGTTEDPQSVVPPVEQDPAELDADDAVVDEQVQAVDVDESDVNSIDDVLPDPDTQREAASDTEEPTEDPAEIVDETQDLGGAVDALLESEVDEAAELESLIEEPEHAQEMSSEVSIEEFAADLDEMGDFVDESMIEESLSDEETAEDPSTESPEDSKTPIDEPSEDDLIQNEKISTVSSSDALDDSMDLLDNALAEAADDMLEGDFVTEEGDLVSGDASNSEIEQALQDKPTLEPDPEILDDIAGDLLEATEAYSDESESSNATEPEEATDAANAPSKHTRHSPKEESSESPIELPVESPAESSVSTTTPQPAAAVDPEVLSEIEALEELKANEPTPIPAWFERAVEIIRPKIDRIDPLKGKTMDAFAMVIGAALVAIITHAAPIAASGMILVSKPLANKSPELRNAVGYIAMWTGFLAIVLWVYLLMFRSPAIPTPESAPTRVINADESIVVQPVVEVLP